MAELDYAKNYLTSSNVEYYGVKYGNPFFHNNNKFVFPIPHVLRGLRAKKSIWNNAIICYFSI